MGGCHTGHIYKSTCNASHTLSNSYGLEPVQLSEQTGALRRMKAINKLLGSSGWVEGLHRLLQGVCAQVTPLHHHGERGLRGELQRGCLGGRLVGFERGSGQTSPGSEREGRPQDSPQAGQHLWDGEVERRAGNLMEQSRRHQAWLSPLNAHSPKTTWRKDLYNYLSPVWNNRGNSHRTITSCTLHRQPGLLNRSKHRPGNDHHTDHVDE